MVRGQPSNQVGIGLVPEKNNYLEIIYTTLRHRRSWQEDNCYGMYIHWDDYEKVANEIYGKIKGLKYTFEVIDTIEKEIKLIENNLSKTALAYKAEYGM